MKGDGRPESIQRQYMLLYLLTYMAIGSLTPLIGQYLSETGLSGTRIGIVTSAGTLTAVFANPFWGGVYTLSKRRHFLVACLCAGAACISMILRLQSSFFMILPFFIGMYFLQAPVMSLSDALSIDDRVSFGTVRTFGAAGFAIAVFVTARIADAFGLDKIFPAYSICYGAAAAVIILIAVNVKGRTRGMPDPVSGQRNGKTGEQKNRLGVFGELLRDRKFVMLVLCAFFVNGTDIANNTFFGFLYLKGGGTLAGVGTAFLLMAGSEAPFMAAASWFSSRFGRGKILLLAIVVSAVRFGWYGTSPSWILLLASFALQGFVNGITLVEFVRFVSDLVPGRTRGAAITLYYALGSSASTIVCQAAGGVVLDSFGAPGVYVFFSVFNAAGAVLFCASGLYREKG